MKGSLQRWWTRRFWRRQYAEFDRYTAEVNWLRSPLLQRLYINPLISSHPDKDWLYWLQETYFPQPAAQGLSLGCGAGQLERLVIQRNLCRRLEACDLSPDAVAQARAEAEAAGLGDRTHFFVADLNTLELPSSHYDLILCPMSLHHLRNLEQVYAQARAALRPGGLLALNEFVGPDRLQWSPKQLRAANELLQRLPRRYRRNLDPRWWGRLLEPYRRRVRRRPRWRMLLDDPSESVRSSEVVPLLEREFTIVERKDYGGTLLHLVLDRIAGNFQDTEADRQLLLELCHYERTLIEKGELPSDFTVIVARPKAEPPERNSQRDTAPSQGS